MAAASRENHKKRNNSKMRAGVGGFEPPTYSLGGYRPILTRPHAPAAIINRRKEGIRLTNRHFTFKRIFKTDGVFYILV
jgi:hypothetical protein